MKIYILPQKYLLNYLLIECYKFQHVGQKSCHSDVHSRHSFKTYASESECRFICEHSIKNCEAYSYWSIDQDRLCEIYTKKCDDEMPLHSKQHELYIKENCFAQLTTTGRANIL